MSCLKMISRGVVKRPSRYDLLSDTELLDDGTIALDVLLHQVVEKVSSVTNHLEKAAAAVMVVSVALQMLVKAVDSRCENSDLNLRAAGVLFVDFVLLNQSLLFFL